MDFGIDELKRHSYAIMIEIVSHWNHTCRLKPVAKAPCANLTINIQKQIFIHKFLRENVRVFIQNFRKQVPALFQFLSVFIELKVKLFILSHLSFVIAPRTCQINIWYLPEIWIPIAFLSQSHLIKHCQSQSQLLPVSALLLSKGLWVSENYGSQYLMLMSIPDT